MKATIVPGVFTWSVFQPDRGMDFNGCFVESPHGNFVVDPIAPTGDTLQMLIARGLSAIVITNRDHQRSAADVAAATGAAVIASVDEAPLLSLPVARTVSDGDDLFGWRVLAMHGAKTAGELALYSWRARTVILGDILWGAPAGDLMLMPDDKLSDAERASYSIRKLRALPAIDHVLVGDGTHIFGTGRESIDRALLRRRDPKLARVNIDELTLISESSDPPPYLAQWAEIGLLLGAQRLGYAATRLRKGDVYCPLHWHTQEEELFIVLSGTPSVRTSNGTVHLRSGDCIAFPTSRDGAHSLYNEADEDAVVILIANSDAGDVCYYPDSNKHLVEATGMIVRNEPELDYYDREL